MAGTTPAAGHGSAERAGRHRAHWAAVWLLTGLTAAAYSVFALARYYTFHTGSYDLVIFDQAVRSYAHFQPGISITTSQVPLGTHWQPRRELIRGFTALSIKSSSLSAIS